MSAMSKSPEVHLVTDTVSISMQHLQAIVRIAVNAGVDVIQLREKERGTRAFTEIAKSLKSITSHSKTKFIINDNMTVMQAVDADGIHLGQSDLSVITAREMLGETKIVGLTVETLEQATRANLLPVDYLGVSTIYSSATKYDAPPPWSQRNLIKLRKSSQHKLIGIGGITADNTAPIMEIGFDGVAVVSYLCCNKPLPIIQQRVERLIQETKSCQSLMSTS